MKTAFQKIFTLLAVVLIIASCNKEELKSTGKTIPRCAEYSNSSQNYTIQGPNQLCINNTETYTIPNFPLDGGGFVTWSVDQPGVASIQPNGTTVSVTRLTSGSFILKAYVWTGSLCSVPSWLEDKTITDCSTTFSVIVTKVEPQNGYIPSINFFDPATNQSMLNSTFYSSYSSISVPNGVYDLHITQTNNKPITVTISGYQTQNGSTVIYNNVSIQGAFPAIMIKNH